MGKVKRTVRTVRSTPFGAIPVVEATAPVKEATVPVLAKLSAADPAERVWAVASISNLLLNGDATIRRLLLSKQIIPQLIIRLSDASLDVIVESAGALRNLIGTADVEEGAAKEMWREGILGHIVTLIEKAVPLVQSFINPTAEADADAARLGLALADNLISIVASLTADLGGDSRVIDALVSGAGAPAIPSLLASCVQYAKALPAPLVLTAAYCIYAMASEGGGKRGASILPLLREPEQRSALQASITALANGEADHALTCVLLIGALWQSDATSSVPFHPTAIPLLLTFLSTPLPSLIEEERAILKARSESGEDVAVLDTRQDKLEDRWNGLQLALELLANVSVQQWEGDAAEASDDEMEEGDSDAEDDEGPDAEEEEDDAVMEALAFSEANANGGEDGALATEALMGSVSTEDVILRTLQPLAEGVHGDSALFSASATGVQTRALGCIGNWLAPQAEAKSGWFAAPASSPIPTLYAWALDLLHQYAAEPEVVEAALSSVLWTLARGTTGALPITQEHINGFITLHASATPAGKVALVAILGQIARQPDVQVNRTIGVWFMTLLASDAASIAEKVEALDAIFDIYADEESIYDAPVFIGDGFLPHLKTLLPRFRSAIRVVDKRRQRELRERADIAILNLREFIKYRQSVQK